MQARCVSDVKNAIPVDSSLDTLPSRLLLLYRFLLHGARNDHNQCAQNERAKSRKQHPKTPKPSPPWGHAHGHTDTGQPCPDPVFSGCFVWRWRCEVDILHHRAAPDRKTIGFVERLGYAALRPHHSVGAWESGRSDVVDSETSMFSPRCANLSQPICRGGARPRSGSGSRGASIG